MRGSEGWDDVRHASTAEWRAAGGGSGGGGRPRERIRCAKYFGERGRGRAQGAGTDVRVRACTCVCVCLPGRTRTVPWAGGRAAISEGPLHASELRHNYRIRYPSHDARPTAVLRGFSQRRTRVRHRYRAEERRPASRESRRVPMRQSGRAKKTAAERRGRAHGATAARAQLWSRAESQRQRE